MKRIVVAIDLGCFGGAQMPVATIEMLAEKLPHLQLLNAYGATETTSPSTIMPRTQWRGHVDSVGITDRGGFKVFSAEVENVTTSIEGILECG